MAKNYFVGDIHGKSYWKQVLDVYKDGDHVYFVGDFFDHMNRSRGDDPTWENTWQNWLDIKAFALANEGHVHFCIGNHDNQYLGCNLDACGDRETDRPKLLKIIKELRSMERFFKLYYVVGDYIVSHAGVSKQWVSDINELSLMTPMDATAMKSNKASCIWIRPDQLIGSEIDGYKQIIGHTPVDFLESKYNLAGVKTGKYITTVGVTTFIDTVGEDVLALPYKKEKKIIDKANVCRKAASLLKYGEATNKSDAMKKAWAYYKAL